MISKLFPSSETGARMESYAWLGLGSLVWSATHSPMHGLAVGGLLGGLALSTHLFRDSWVNENENKTNIRVEIIDPPPESEDMLRLKRVYASLDPPESNTQLFITDDPETRPTAYAYRRCIDIKKEVLRALTDRELAFVLEHEHSHIKNQDGIVNGSFFAAAQMLNLAGAVLAPIVSIVNSGPSQTDANTILSTTLIAAFSTASAITFSALATSRANEFRADTYATQRTQDPVSGISSLNKVKSMNDAYYSCRLVTPWQKAVHWMKASMFRTHPHLEDRITNIHKASGEKMEMKTVNSHIPTPI